MLTTNLIIALAGFAFVQPAPHRSPQQKSPRKVLFIGNSLTAANDLPSMVQAISRLPGRVPMECTAITQGGASLEDHWAAGKVRSEIAKQKWDFVVLQQGPSSLDDSRKNLRAFVKVYDPLIRRSGARTALYMVWPEKARFSMFQRVSDSYRIAAEDVRDYYCRRVMRGLRRGNYNRIWHYTDQITSIHRRPARCWRHWSFIVACQVIRVHYVPRY